MLVGLPRAQLEQSLETLDAMAGKTTLIREEKS
jgi:hypothetical protein